MRRTLAILATVAFAGLAMGQLEATAGNGKTGQKKGNLAAGQKASDRVKYLLDRVRLLRRQQAPIHPFYDGHAGPIHPFLDRQYAQRLKAVHPFLRSDQRTGQFMLVGQHPGTARGAPEPAGTVVTMVDGRPMRMQQGMQPGQEPMASKAELAADEKEYSASKAAFLKHKADAKAKRRYVVATVRYGHASMTGDLPAKVKYRQALHLYREALRTDPKEGLCQQVAQPEANLIISVYKSMKRPVPND